MEKTTPPADQAAAPAPRAKRAFIMKRPLTPARRRTRRASIAAAGVGLVIVAALAVPRRISNPAAGVPAAGAPAALAATPAPAADLAPVTAPGVTVEVTAPAPPAPAPASPPHSAAEPSKRVTASKAATTRPAATPKSAHAGTAASSTVTAASGSETTVAAAAAPVAAPAAEPAAGRATIVPPSVTITGCLEMSVGAGEFRLTDTEGADAPKSRSWKSGFLKKKSSSIALVEPPDPHALQGQVGKRVAASGVLTSHELKVSSLRVVGSSCD
jgi:hypothetical protein